MKVDESKLKCEILTKFRKERVITRKSIIASEYVLGQTGRRSDLAVWNGRFIGIEIKSARDTLMRLPAQLDAYRRFFDHVIVLCDEIHLSKVEEICSKTVGIYSWRDSEKIEVIREPQYNSKIDRQSCIRSLTARQLGASLGCNLASGVYRSELERLLHADKNIDVRKILTDGFQSTYKATSNSFLEAIAGKKITEKYLPLLSRFATVRQVEKLVRKERENYWETWLKQAEVAFR